MAKAPGPRGLTIQEARAKAIEKRTFHLTWLVALLAATMSFVALQWVGVNMGMYRWIAPLLPLSIDGLGIICSFGIIRSAAGGQPFRDRASEWIGLGFSLTLSMLGNGAHALGTVPPWLKIIYSVAVPVIVAYAIHVLGRYQESGVSAHVLAGDPDRVHFDLAQLGDDTARPARPAPRATQPSPRAQTSTPARAETPAKAAPAARAPRATDAREQVFEEYRARLANNDRMEGGEIAERLNLHPGRARSLRKEWDQRIDELAVAEPQRDAIVEQLSADTHANVRASA